MIDYHESTKHSLNSVRSSRHVLDWPNQPLPFKIYTSLEAIPIGLRFGASSASALDAVAGACAKPLAGELNREMLARLCYFSNGVTRVVRQMPFRAAATTGALYHIELYAICGELADLQAGVYHYAAHDNTLRQLRSGDVRRIIVSATGDEPGVAQVPLVLALTSTWWRNSWKYQARAYRHAFWDAGTILANLLAVACGNGVPAQVVYGFADAEVNQLLDVDPSHEATICLVALGAGALPPSEVLRPPALNLPTQRLSHHEVAYPEIVAAHTASALGSGQEVAAWRNSLSLWVRARRGLERNPPPARDARRPLPEGEAIESVILRRGSSRRFAREAITHDDLALMLDLATAPIPSDAGTRVTEPYLIVNAVDGLASGAYALERATGALRLLKRGVFRREAEFLDLGQELAGDAALNVYWLTDLHQVTGSLGERGYRVAQLEAAIEGGKLYLAAYALGLGATGLTFFDDDVVKFFSPHAAGKSVMFLMAVGHPAPRRG